MAASGAKLAVREADFQNSNLNDCFTQQRPFRAEENHDNERQLTAEAVSKGKIDSVRSFPSQANFQLKSVAY